MVTDVTQQARLRQTVQRLLLQQAEKATDSSHPNQSLAQARFTALASSMNDFPASMMDYYAPLMDHRDVIEQAWDEMHTASAEEDKPWMRVFDVHIGELSERAGLIKR